jgi:hypothetical protein
MTEPLAEVLRSEDVIVEMARLVVVACDEVELTAVKFWRVDEPLARMFAKVPSPVDVRSPPFAVVKKKLVVEARVEKSAVVVAFVVVELPVIVKLPMMVEEAEEMNPVKVGVPVKAGEAESTRDPQVPVSPDTRVAISEQSSNSVEARMLMPPMRVSNSARVSIDVEEILLLKIDQSAEVRHPKVVELAVSQSMSFRVRVSPSPKVRGTW